MCLFVVIVLSINFNCSMASTSISEKKLKSKKREIIDEGKLFNDKWTNDYFLAEANKKALCLICREFVAVIKEYNLKRHYIQKHSAKYNVYLGICCKDKISELRKVCVFSTKAFSKCYYFIRFYCKS